jgi:hypothetical protein
LKKEWNLFWQKTESMKRNLITIVLLLLGGVVFGQIKKTVDIPITKGDTSYNYKWSYNLHGKLKMKDLMQSTAPFHFRFWQDGQVVDLWTTDNKTWQGRVTDFIWEHKPAQPQKKKNKTARIYTMQSRLDTALARRAFGLIAKDSILQIPSEEMIKGWSQVLDGSLCIIEISSPGAYAFRSYNTPTEQKDLKEAKKIVRFAENLNKLINLPEYDRKFQGTLPGGYYSNGGAWVRFIEDKASINYYIDNDLEEEDREMFQ